MLGMPILYASGYPGALTSSGGQPTGIDAYPGLSVNELHSGIPDNKPSAFDSLGLPNENGKISWPVGLRILSPEEEGGVRQEIETLIEQIAGQTDTTDARLNEAFDQAVEKLQKLLRRDNERLGLPSAVHRESEVFVQKLKAAIKPRG
jgi:hypothetical protein